MENLLEDLNDLVRGATAATAQTGQGSGTVLRSLGFEPLQYRL